VRLFGKVDGSVDRFDRAAWLTPPFDLAWGTGIIGGPYGIAAGEVFASGCVVGEMYCSGTNAAEVFCAGVIIGLVDAGQIIVPPPGLEWSTLGKEDWEDMTPYEWEQMAVTEG